MIKFVHPERDLIVISTETRWDEAPRMRHYVANQLSKNFNVLFCELYTKGLPQSRQVNDNLIVHQVGYYMSGVSKYRLSKGIFNLLQSKLIVATAKRYTNRKVLLLNFRYDFWNIYQTPYFDKKYFFLNDDFVNMNPNDPEIVKRRKQRNLDKTVSMCDRVFTSSEPLAKDVEHLINSISVIHSGHDFVPQYGHHLNRNGQGKIEVCVMGFINHNLEYDWLIKLSLQENINVNLVGPLEDEAIRTKLKSFPQIYFQGPKTGLDLQNFLMQQDVLLMPYTASLLNTKASVPAKLFQYLACGKPVVSSLMPDLIELPPGFVYQSSNEMQFIDNVKLAFTDDTLDLSNQRMKFSEMHTWDQRGDELINILSSDLQNG